jgi:hypothetical protein
LHVYISVGLLSLIVVFFGLGTGSGLGILDCVCGFGSGMLGEGMLASKFGECESVKLFHYNIFLL